MKCLLFYFEILKADFSVFNACGQAGLNIEQSRPLMPIISPVLNFLEMFLHINNNSALINEKAQYIVQVALRPP